MARIRNKVLVAMSGGVDSSVAAALLCRDKRYEVAGAFMKNWSEGMQNAEFRMQNVCTWKKDRRDALRVAAMLDIPLLTLDFEKEYRQMVAEYMFREYKAGRTPNPDVMCNKYIKFGVWLAHARRLGFDYLATGHYARLAREAPRNKKQAPNKFQIPDSKFRIRLLEAMDKNKDQTYFLHQLTQEQLSHTLFPVGDYTKPQVRALARKFGLPTAEREESMGICFVGERPMKEFLLQKIKPKKGKIVTTTGEVAGEHDGLSFYTIGQRHGLFLSSRAPTVVGINSASGAEGSVGEKAMTSESISKEKSRSLRQISRLHSSRSSGTHYARDDKSEPLYIVDKRIKTNELVIGYENDPALYKKEIMVGEVNWISGQEPKFPLKCEVRLRHRQSLQDCRIRNNESGIMVEFDEPERAVTPGQFAVFYKRGECLGGGVII